MKYVQYLNSLIKEKSKNCSELVFFGQNINAGSSLSGLTRGLTIDKSGLIINTQNSENCLVGIGFGLMMNSVSSVFFMKQMDFLLLGIDHLVNTYNIVRQSNPKASFTIFPVIVDSGYEGPQSSLNNFDDFCSIAGIEGYSLTNKEDSRVIIDKHLISPGFRIISTGQRSLRENTIELGTIKQEKNGKYFQYRKGSEVSIVCFNQALSYGKTPCDKMLDKSISASLFSINFHLFTDYDFILEDIQQTKKLVIIDDSKSRNRLSDKFLSFILESCDLNKYQIVSRKHSLEDYYPQHDKLNIDYDNITNDFL